MLAAIIIVITITTTVSELQIFHYSDEPSQAFRHFTHHIKKLHVNYVQRANYLTRIAIESGLK